MQGSWAFTFEHIQEGTLYTDKKTAFRHPFHVTGDLEPVAQI
jgi:hypothetical protein